MSIFTAIGNFFIKIGAKKAPKPLPLAPTPQEEAKVEMETPVTPETPPSISAVVIDPNAEKQVTLIQDLKATLSGIDELSPIHTFLHNVANLPSVKDIESKFLAAADYTAAEPGKLWASAEAYNKHIENWSMAKIKAIHDATAAETAALETKANEATQALVIHKNNIVADTAAIGNAAVQVSKDFGSIMGSMKEHLKL